MAAAREQIFHRGAPSPAMGGSSGVGFPKRSETIQACTRDTCRFVRTRVPNFSNFSKSQFGFIEPALEKIETHRKRHYAVWWRHTQHPRGK